MPVRVTVTKEMWKPKVKLGKKRTIYVVGYPKKLVFTKLKGRGDAREFYVCEAYVRSPVPWDTTVYGPKVLDNLSAAQVAACNALASASKGLAGISRVQRKVALSAVLKGADYGGKVKKKPRAPKLSEEELAARIAGLKA